MGMSENPAWNPITVARVFRIVAIGEALSWAALLTGMYFKWIAQTTEVGVNIAGPIHGAMFMLYLLVALIAARTFQWSVGLTLGALAAGIPPFFTIPFEMWASRKGHLTAQRVG